MRNNALIIGYSTQQIVKTKQFSNDLNTVAHVMKEGIYRAFIADAHTQ